MRRAARDYDESSAEWGSPQDVGGRRFLFYTNECVGLGHLRRTTTLARATTELDLDSSALIITGSAASFGEAPPPRVDTIKLPVLARDQQGAYWSSRLGMGSRELQGLRAQLALTAAEAFEPAVAIVDKVPLGLSDELIPTLESLRRSGRTRLVLGLRDIEDDPAAVRRRWGPGGLVGVIRRYYDAVVVYGPEGSMDALTCIGAEELDVPVHHVGYVGAPMPASGPADLQPGYLLVTVGGGADGFALLDSVLQAVRAEPVGRPVVMVTGPLMPPSEVASLHGQAAALGVRLFEMRQDMPEVIAGADAVVAMAGYNTVSEVLRAGKPALLVPRVRPSREQLVRARVLAEAGTADMLHPDELTPARMRTAIEQLIRRERPSFDPADYDGAARTAELLHGLARQSAGRRDPVGVGA